MRIPFISRFFPPPFDALLEHAEKVKECGWAFQQAMECYVSAKCQEFEEYRQEVVRLESEADAIKRRFRGHMPPESRMPVSRFELFMYIREQDKVLDAVEESLHWVSYRQSPVLSEQLKKQLLILVDGVIEPMEDLSKMVGEAIKYFETYSEKQRKLVKGIIHNLRKRENEADQLEDEFKVKIFTLEKDPVALFHLVRLAETIGSIADHAENSGDVMRAMVAKRK
jgi:predicted phosphate transport protein (TIGR00153 family)